MLIFTKTGSQMLITALHMGVKKWQPNVHRLMSDALKLYSTVQRNEVLFSQIRCNTDEPQKHIN